MHTSTWNKSVDIFHSMNFSCAAVALTATLDNDDVVDVGISEALGNVNVVTIPATAHGLAAGSIGYLSGSTNYNGVHKLISVATDSFNIVAPYVAENLAGSETIVATLVPTEDFKLVEVRVHLSSASTQDSFIVTLDSGLGSAYDVVLQTQAMAGLTDYIWVLSEAERRLFNSDDKLVFAYANNDGDTVGLEVLYQVNS